MTDKRRARVARGSGSSPGGRSPRRSGRPDRVRRARPGRSTADTTERLVGAASGDRRRERTSATSTEQRSERTFFGLSTGRAVVLAVVVCALALTLAVPLRTYFTQRSDAKEVAAERVALETDLQKLREKKLQQSDPAYIAAEARERLRLVMPGETPFQVQLPGAFEAEQARLATPEPKGGPWYTDLWKQVSEAPPAPEPPPAMPVQKPPPPEPSTGTPG